MEKKKNCTGATVDRAGDISKGEVVIKEQEYTKQQILASARYKGRKDLVTALLDDNRTYTIAEVDQKISQFMKGQVK